MIPLLFSVAIASTTVVFLPTQCVMLNTNLRYQMTDSITHGSVSMLQNFLVAKGYLHTKTTGYFGLYTLHAAQAFQKDNSLYAAGFVGPQTRLKISTLTCSPLKNSAALGTSTASLNSTGTITSTTSAVTSISVSGGGGGGGGSVSSGGSSVEASPLVLPDSVVAYLKIKTEYDAALTLDAFVAVSEKYASAARQNDVLAQKAYLDQLSVDEKNGILNSSIRGIVPARTEFNTVVVSQSGTTATILVTPLLTSGKDAKGTIIMVFEGDQWKLQSENWQNDAGLGIEPLPSASGG